MIDRIRIGRDIEIAVEIVDIADITGYQFFFTAKLNPTDADADAAIDLAFLAGDNPADVLTGSPFKVLHIPNSITSTLTPGKLFWEISYMDAGGLVGTIYPQDSHDLAVLTVSYSIKDSFV